MSRPWVDALHTVVYDNMSIIIVQQMLQPYDVAGATMTNHIWRTLTRDEAGWAGGGTAGTLEISGVTTTTI